MIQLVLGLVLVMAVSAEAIATVTMTGGGPVAMGMSWLVSRWLQWGGGAARPRPWLGMSVIFATVAFWALAIWGGWLLVFTSDPQAVVHAASGEPASLWTRVYFSGYTLSTLGLGDAVPGTPLYQVLTALSSLTGLFVITLVLSFVVPMAQGEMERRELALFVHHIADNPTDLLDAIWDREARDVPVLTTLAPMLVQLEHTHRRYPALHFASSAEPAYAVALAVSTLDEVLTGLVCAEAVDPSPSLRVSRRAIAGFLASLEEVYVDPDGEAPPRQAFAALGRPDSTEASVERFERRRARLLTLVRVSGWSWEDVCTSNPEPGPVRVMFGR